MSYAKDPMSETRAKASKTSQEPVQAEQAIPIDGFKQVIEMLRIADPAFRESLLRRLAARDQNLANNLRRDLMSQKY